MKSDCRNRMDNEVEARQIVTDLGDAIIALRVLKDFYRDSSIETKTVVHGAQPAKVDVADMIEGLGEWKDNLERELFYCRTGMVL